MTAELLPATFPTSQAAKSWSEYLPHRVLDIVESKEKPGRYQVKIDRKKEKQD